MKEVFFGGIIVIIATLIGSWGALFLKKISKPSIKIFLDKFFYLGALFYGTSALIFVYALQYGELSILYSISALSYIWISFLSIIFLKEKMNEFKWFGIIMIIVGVILIGFGA